MKDPLSPEWRRRVDEAAERVIKQINTTPPKRKPLTARQQELVDAYLAGDTTPNTVRTVAGLRRGGYPIPRRASPHAPMRRIMDAVNAG